MAGKGKGRTEGGKDERGIGGKGGEGREDKRKNMRGKGDTEGE